MLKRKSLPKNWRTSQKRRIKIPEEKGKKIKHIGDE